MHTPFDEPPAGARARVYRSVMQVIDSVLDSKDITIRHTSEEDWMWRTTIEVLEPVQLDEFANIVGVCAGLDPPVYVTTASKEGVHLFLSCQYTELESRG